MVVAMSIKHIIPTSYIAGLYFYKLNAYKVLWHKGVFLRKIKYHEKYKYSFVIITQNQLKVIGLHL